MLTGMNMCQFLYGNLGEITHVHWLRPNKILQKNGKLSQTH